MTENLQQRVTTLFNASIATKQAALPVLTPLIITAAERISHCLQTGGKLLICGNGGSAADAQHLSAELVGRFERERLGLPAIALTTDTSTLTALANDYGYDAIFARQIHALGKAGDGLLAISTSGNSSSVINAVAAAQGQGLFSIALTGRDGGRIATRLDAESIELRVPSDSTARIQEVHGLIVHCLCDLIDQLLANTVSEK